MKNMHLMFAHEHTSTLRIERLTPSEEMAVNMDALVAVYHEPSDEVIPVRMAELIWNPTAYRDRGWCVAEMVWSSNRSVPASKEIDDDEFDAEAQVPMPPEVFLALFRDKLRYVHRSDHEVVLKLQERVSCL